MTSVIDFYKKLGEDPNLEFGTLRHVARELQRDGILPKGGRGGGRAAPVITAEHCALFLLGMAGTSNWNEAGKAARTLSGLVSQWGDGSNSTLLDDLESLIGKGDGFVDDDHYVNRIVIAHFDPPLVEIQCSPLDEGKGESFSITYTKKGNPPARDHRDGGFHTAAIIDGGIFKLIAAIIDPKDSADGK